MPRTIMGLETRACINGLNKTDFENVKKIPTLETETDEIKNETIPSLDDRITALEQGGSGGSEWEEVDVSTYNKAHAQVNTLFDYDGDYHYTKYPMIIIFVNEMFYIKSNSSADSGSANTFQRITITFNYSTPPTQATETIEEVTLYNIFFNSSVTGTDFRLPTSHVQLNTDNTITITRYSTTNMYRNRLQVFVKKS